MDAKSPNARFIIKCKLTGLGAVNVPAQFIGTNEEIGEYLRETEKLGYTVSDSVIEDYVPSKHYLHIRYSRED
jgi:alpha-D-ribose 1-methylphosphonate 5-triphosphate diphosphatase PhnM